MKKIVRGKIEKHYCDKCGINIYDYVPKGTSFKLMGCNVPEHRVERKVQSMERGYGYNKKEYCIDCYNQFDEGAWRY